MPGTLLLSLSLCIVEKTLGHMSRMSLPRTFPKGISMPNVSVYRGSKLGASLNNKCINSAFGEGSCVGKRVKQDTCVKSSSVRRSYDEGPSVKDRMESDTSVKVASVKDVHADGVYVSGVSLPRSVLFKVSV